MKQQQLLLTLESDIVLSKRSASAGGHESLDYIPGANLLGYAAAQLYGSLTREEQYLVFHSGKFRFGNGLPARDKAEAFPSPLCWHYAKNDGEYKDRETARLIPGRIVNLQHAEFEKGKQPKPLRSGYINLAAQVVEPRKQFRMKTAIDENTGRASEAQLFGYECLNRGQTFISTLSADDEVSTDLFHKVLVAISGEIRIGRSRSAEYGRVTSRKITTEDRPSNDVEHGKVVSLWCLSDMALQTENGMSLLTPRCASDLGLSKGRLVLEKSFIRTRSYAPFNGQYARHDMERQVIIAGSVLNFEFEQALTLADKAQLDRGVGLYRQSGLGRVWANPALLQTATPDNNFKKPAPQQVKKKPVNLPSHPLRQWLMEKAKGQVDAHDARQTGLTWASELIQLYVVAQRLSGAPKGVMIGPSSSQWGAILSAAKKPANHNLHWIIFHKDNGLCGHDNWTVRTALGNNSTTFSAWLKDKLENVDANQAAKVASTLCHKIKSHLDKQDVKQ